MSRVKRTGSLSLSLSAKISFESRVRRSRSELRLHHTKVNADTQEVMIVANRQPFWFSCWFFKHALVCLIKGRHEPAANISGVRKEKKKTQQQQLFEKNSKAKRPRNLRRLHVLQREEKKSVLFCSLPHSCYAQNNKKHNPLTIADEHNRQSGRRSAARKSKTCPHSIWDLREISTLEAVGTKPPAEPRQPSCRGGPTPLPLPTLRKQRRQTLRRDAARPPNKEPVRHAKALHDHIAISHAATTPPKRTKHSADLVLTQQCVGRRSIPGAHEKADAFPACRRRRHHTWYNRRTAARQRRA